MAPPAAQGGDQESNGGNMMRFMVKTMAISMAFNFFMARQRGAQPASSGAGVSDIEQQGGPEQQQGPRAQKGGMRNLYGPAEECELYVHLSNGSKSPPVAAVVNQTLASQQGFQTLWHTRVWYEVNATPASVNVSVGPLLPAELSGDVLPYVHATLLRTALLDKIEEIPPEQVITNSLPLVAKMRELSSDAGAENLFAEGGAEVAPKKNMSAAKLPYFKTKIEIRPVFDQTVQNAQTLKQGPFKHIVAHPDLGIYKPYLYVSDFWLLEKDYVALNESLAESPLNLTLSYSTVGLLVWSMQAQMAEQWTQQGEWGVMDTQRDSFMLKRLMIDTNPYLLAFSGLFIALHTVFSMLAFKNDIQFWRKNESMQGLSAQSMIVSFVCQLITSLYLLDSRETSRLILFEICLDTALSSWKLKKAVKVELTSSFPFISLGGQKGYENKNTSKYDSEALCYMCALMTPLFVGYSIRSAIYGKHRGWYSFLVGTAAGGVYTFGFVMMTPQLYINYKLKSVEHLPWRALTYKAMNTFVDDIAALLIDMPLMHRLSCFRDDIVFFIYIYQRWKYRVDKSRPSIWVGEQDGQQEAIGAEAAAGGQAGQDEAPASGAAEGAAAGEAAAEAAAEASAEEASPQEEGAAGDAES